MACRWRSIAWSIAICPLLLPLLSPLVRAQVDPEASHPSHRKLGTSSHTAAPLLGLQSQQDLETVRSLQRTLQLLTDGTSPTNPETFAARLNELALDPRWQRLALEYARLQLEGEPPSPAGDDSLLGNPKLLRELQERTIEWLQDTHSDPQGRSILPDDPGAGETRDPAPPTLGSNLDSSDGLGQIGDDPTDPTRWDRWFSRTIDSSLRHLIESPDLALSWEQALDASGRGFDPARWFPSGGLRPGKVPIGLPSGSGPSATIALALAALALGAAGWWVSSRRRRASIAGESNPDRSVPYRLPWRIKNRQDIIAFHDGISISLIGLRSIFLSHREVRRILTERYPELSEEIVRLSTIYGWCRYAPSDRRLDADRLEAIRTILTRFRRLTHPATRRIQRESLETRLRPDSPATHAGEGAEENE